MKNFHVLFLTCIMLKTFALTCDDLKQGGKIPLRANISGTLEQGFAIINEINPERPLFSFKIQILLVKHQTKSISAHCSPITNYITVETEASRRGYINLNADSTDVNFSAGYNFFS